MLKFHPYKGRLVKGILLIVYVSGAMCNFLQIYAQFIFEFHYCIKSVSQAFNSHVSSSTNPCISKAIHMLLMHEFGSLNALVLGHILYDS